MQKVLNIIKRNKCLCAIVISFIICLVFSIMFGFRFSSYSNDDYNISLLISNGDYNTFYVNVLLSYPLTVVQKIVSEINCFVCMQYIGSFVSMTILNYVFLKKYDVVLGVVFCTIFSSFIFIYNILMVQYTHTSITLFVAGAALCLSLCFYKQRKTIKIFQVIIAAIMMILSSMVRFEPFLLCSIFYGITIILFCVFNQKIHSIKFNSIIHTTVSSIRKCSKIIIAFLLSFCLAIGLLCISNLISSNDAYICEMQNYNVARTAVVDYDIIPYEGNEEFYNSIDIYSSEELSMITFDMEKYDTVTLNKITEKSREVLYNGDSKLVYAVKNTLNRFYRVVKDIYRNIVKTKEFFHINVSSKVFVLLVSAVFVLVIVGLILILRRLYQKSIIKFTAKNMVLSILIVLIWLVFFLIATINNDNYLFVVLFAIILLSIICKSSNWWIIYCFSLLPMMIYLYQSNFRMSLRVVYTFMLPSVVFMLLLMDEKKLCLNISHKSGVFLRSGLAVSLLCASFIIACSWICIAYYPNYSKDYDNQLRHYMDVHSDEVFVSDIHNNYLVDKGYYNALIKPSIPNNEIVTSGWIMITNYFQDSMKTNKIDSLLPDMVDSRVRLVLVETDSSSIQDQTNQYEKFYNNHYYNGKQTISLQLDEELSCYDSLKQETKVGLFKVVKR